MKVHVLDANALWRFLNDGPGASIVADLFKQARRANQSISMSVINWGEVHFTIMRRIGRERADGVMNGLDGLPLSISEIDPATTRRAADIGASYGLHYARIVSLRRLPASAASWSPAISRISAKFRGCSCSNCPAAGVEPSPMCQPQ